MSHTISQYFNEEKWIAQVRLNIDEDEEEDESTQQVSIFKIPNIFLSDDTKLFVPQQVSFGPYHYMCDELSGMERFKLFAAKRTRKKLPCSKFEYLIEQLVKFEMKIRACYNNFLVFKSETLAWLMAIDACFMIEVMDAINDHLQIGKEIPHLLDHKGYKLSYSTILQDLAMLENQIPLFVLRKVLEFQQPFDKVDERLISMMMNICKELSPFGLMGNYQSTLSEFHLLDFLYQVIIVDVEDNCEIVQIQEDNGLAQVSKIGGDAIQHSSAVCASRVISALHEFVMTLARKVKVSGLVKLLTMLTWKVISSIPPISMVKQPIEYYLNAADNEGTNQRGQDGASNIKKPALIEEIKIPSVSDLITSGINFLPSTGEVVLKNLISYEALVIFGPMVLTRYTEFMNGIIDTDEDVRLLRENGIIINYLKSDGEVTNIWNEMRKSTKSTRVPLLDKVIEDINDYYDTRWHVKAKQIVKLYVSDPWKFLICLGIIIFLSLMIVQALFSIYRFVRF